MKIIIKSTILLLLLLLFSFRSQKKEDINTLAKYNGYWKIENMGDYGIMFSEGKYLIEYKRVNDKRVCDDIIADDIVAYISYFAYDLNNDTISLLSIPTFKILEQKMKKIILLDLRTQDTLKLIFSQDQKTPVYVEMLKRNIYLKR